MTAEAAVPLRIHVARGLGERLGGLLVRPRLGPSEALWLAPCNSVHTAFMTYAIDVAFASREGRVIEVVEGLEPWRCAACWRAGAALELLAGQAQALGIRPGIALPLGAVPLSGGWPRARQRNRPSP